VQLPLLLPPPPLLQVARWLGERLADPYRYKYMATDNDMPLMKEYQPHNLDDRCVCGCVAVLVFVCVCVGGCVGGGAQCI
jgi:hypothetical protein